MALLSIHMPIYEFACPKCRVIFNFLTKRITSDRQPACPKCGHKKLAKQMSSFSAPRGAGEPGAKTDQEDAMPDMDNPRMMRAMAELERDMGQLDENNPRHMAHMMRKMKEAMPPGMMPKEMDAAIKRLEKGEDPEKIEADLGDVFGQMGGEEGGEGEGGAGGPGGGYARDSGLYEY